jgi:LysM repeat protein
VPAHRKNRRWSLRSTRSLTLAAAVVGGIATPAVASAATVPAPAHVAPAVAESHTLSAAVPAAFTAPVQIAAPAAAQTAVPQTAAPKAADAKPASHKVVSGDTLSGIAQAALGNGNRYPEIFELNKAKIQADGRHISDPDLILVGWTLDLPTGAAPKAAAAPAPAPAAAPKPVQQSTTQSSSKSTTTQKSTTTKATITQSSGSYANNLSGWINEARDILSSNGYSVSYNAIYQTVMHESAGNPSAVNGWDSNAAAGHPSIGLMQTIQPTFNAFALPGHYNIYNPVDNIIAGARYAASRYGSLDNVVAARCGGSCWFGY